MNYQKEITSNLIDYLINGKIDSTVVDWFDGIAFPAMAINNKRFQFIRKYEQVETINDDTIIPVLLVTAPQMYFTGKILYKDRYQDLKTMLVSDKRTTKAIHYYVIPYANTINGNHLGSIIYNVNIDAMANIDIYGFISDEINQIIKLLYYKQKCGNYYSFSVDSKPFFFVPNSITNIDTGAILKRTLQTYSIRSCHFA